ncbi:MAG: DUF934 domain-containing protein [Herminiimonas sp.]|uniref:DUF934 domain-containing protein n=1 Tax=Herminiimonas sp. TaxID=1926289 RepID=UPI0027222318|nr:DUF934 domain-containing protein [Herminiimonas sp.]MDO9422467.1 DUF934 domain-containing protein [Herminiimonas sp.]
MNTASKELIRIVDDTPIIQVDEWTVLRDVEQGNALVSSDKGMNLILPFSVLGNMSAPDRAGVKAIWISPDDDFESSMEWLDQMEVIAVDFPTFRDGRGYSIGYLLRTRYAWKGELRAIGDVLRDQLNYMRRCGFNVFVLRADKDIRSALKSFNHYSVQYQAGVDEPLPLFRRRAL